MNRNIQTDQEEVSLQNEQKKFRETQRTKKQQNEQLKTTLITLLLKSGVFLAIGTLFAYNLTDQSKYDNCENTSFLNWCKATCISCFLIAFLFVLVEFLPKKQNWASNFIIFSNILSFLLQVVFVVGISYNLDSKCGSLNNIADWFQYIGYKVVIFTSVSACILISIPGLVMTVCGLADMNSRRLDQQKKQQQYQQQ